MPMSLPTEGLHNSYISLKYSKISPKCQTLLALCTPHQKKGSCCLWFGIPLQWIILKRNGWFLVSNRERKGENMRQTIQNLFFSSFFILNYKGCCIHWWICIWLEVLRVGRWQKTKATFELPFLLKRKTAQLLTNI